MTESTTTESPLDLERAEREQLPVTVSAPHEATISAGANAMLEHARSLPVTSQREFEIAATFLSQIKNGLRYLDAERKDLTKPLDELKAKIMNRFRPAITVLEQARDAVDGKMKEHLDAVERQRARERAEAEARQRAEQERIRREAEARAQAEREAALAAKAKADAEAALLRQKAEEEAARLVAAGKEKAAAEAKARAEAEAVERERAAEREAKEREALAQAELKDGEKKALEVESAAVAIPATPSAKGTSIARMEKGRVVDKIAYVRSIARLLGKRPEFASLLDPNEAKLNKMISTFGGAEFVALGIEGVAIEETKTIRSTTR